MCRYLLQPQYTNDIMYNDKGANVPSSNYNPTNFHK